MCGLRRLASLLVISVAAVVMSSCSFAATGCPGRTQFETPMDAAEDAGAVVIGQVEDLVGRTDMFGGIVPAVQGELPAEWQNGSPGSPTPETPSP